MLPSVPGYEVVRRIGRGGMGEIFHAVRVGAGGFRKEVALKRLHVDAAIDGNAVQRFLREARISARLEHANVVRVYDLIEAEGGYYIVMELLHGASLAELLPVVSESGPPPWPPLLQLAADALAGLHYVHTLGDESGAPLGLVHRDLTPRNVFVCEDGVVKVLDFGIAKLRSMSSAGLTGQGTVRGTIEYLSPEQALAQPIDARSDLYQLGATLYAALTSEPPIGTGTPAELIVRAAGGAVTPLAVKRPGLPPELCALVDRALAREPSARFASALEMREHALAVLRSAPAAPPLTQALSRLRERVPVEPTSSPTPPPAALERTAPSPAPAPAKPAPAPTSRRAVLLGGAAAIAAGGGGFAAGRWQRPVTAPAQATAAAAGWPRFRRVTFRRGRVPHALFTPDGRGFVFSAAWAGDPLDTYLGSLDNPEARSLGMPGTQLATVSAAGELFVLVDVERAYGFVYRGTLARGALAGGGLREELEGVQFADTGKNGELLVVRWSGARTTLEYPLGKVLFQTDVDWIGFPRISPRGDRVAFVLFPGRYDDRGTLHVADLSGKVTPVGPEWMTTRSLAWSGDDTVWLSAAKTGMTRDLHAVSLDGSSRVIAAAPVSLSLMDVRGTRALVSRDAIEIGIMFGRRGSEPERDLSWFDASFPIDLSLDGKLLLIAEGGGDAIGSQGYGVYLRRTDGSAAVKLATGHASALSPDGALALVIGTGWDEATLVPTGAGQPRQLRLDGVTGLQMATFFPSGKSLLLGAQTPNGQRIWRVPLDGGAPRELDVKGHVWKIGPCALGDDELVLHEPKTDRLQRVTLSTGAVRPLAGALDGDVVTRPLASGQAVLVRDDGAGFANVFRIDLATGRREKWAALRPADPAGVLDLSPVVMSGDGLAYAYTCPRILSAVHLVDF